MGQAGVLLLLQLGQLELVSGPQVLFCPQALLCFRARSARRKPGMEEKKEVVLSGHTLWTFLSVPAVLHCSWCT